MIPTTDGPLEIFVDIFIFEVSKINDIELTMTFELYFDLMWEEKRFVINETSDKWGQVRVRDRGYHELHCLHEAGFNETRQGHVLCQQQPVFTQEHNHIKALRP